jgi:hypothetical protein
VSVRFNPTVHSTTRVGKPYALWFVKRYKQDAGGCYVRDVDGNWDWYPTPMSDETDTRPEGTTYWVGREYELSDAYATEAYRDGVHGLEPGWTP